MKIETHDDIGSGEHKITASIPYFEIKSMLESHSTVEALMKSIFEEFKERIVTRLIEEHYETIKSQIHVTDVIFDVRRALGDSLAKKVFQSWKE